MGKRIAIYLVGLAITSLGMACIILTYIGAGPWDAVAVGFTNHLGLTIGFWSIVSQAMFILVTWILERTRVRFDSIIPIVIRSCFLDIWIYFVLGNVHFSSSLESQWFTFILGLVLAGLGMGIYLEAKFPKTPVDGLMVAISNRFNWTLSKSRVGIEACGAMIGFLLGGPVGLGTVVIALFLGKIIQISNNRFKKILTMQTEAVKTNL